MENSNAYIEFRFSSKDYPDIDLTINCDQDLTLDELRDYCKRFALAMSFSENSVERLFEGD